MAQHYLLGFAVVVAVFVIGVSSKPSNNEAMTSFQITTEAKEKPDISNKEERSLIYEEIPGVEVGSSNTRDIIEKIKAVNEGLKTPVRRPPINYNTQPQTGGGYVIDKEILEKIQQIITAGKLNPMSLTQKYQVSNTLNNEDLGGPRTSRDMNIYTQSPFGMNQASYPMSSLPYVTSMPVIVMPMQNNMFNGDRNNLDTRGGFQTRQSPALPFNIQWPLAPYFPILIRDPLLNFLGGGNLNSLVDYGQSADVCNRKQKAVDEESTVTDFYGDAMKFVDKSNSLKTISNSRKARAVKKRTISSKSSLANNLDNLKKVKKYFSSSQSTTKKPVKQSYTENQNDDTKTVHSDEGDLRFPFGDFNWFGNRKPVAPSPGFFINRLKVRRGGVAIAGPGGVATAGRGGTAIVGPGGLAYTQPGGLAVAGPSARIIALSSDVDLSSVVSRLQEQAATDGSVPRLLEAIPEGKVVATGPIIYYHPTKQTFQRGGWGWRDSPHNAGRKISGFSRRSDEYQYNGSSFMKGPWMAKDSFLLFLKPKAHAINSARGVAVANPISNVVVSRNDQGSIIHSPVASAIVGPGGIAHAQSDLYLAVVQYLPFYGGAKGNYLEVKKDTSGAVTSEKIVPEDKISSENVFKNSNENLLSKVLAANLNRLRSTSGSLLKLHNLGRRLGFLNNEDKAKFKEQLSSLEETASNTIKVIDDIGTDVDMLFKKNATLKRFEHDEYIEEEGVGIDAPIDNDPQIPLEGATIAESKPVGLAVVGENGIAASRPVATAVASSGIALASPIATAIAGVDPSALGIHFHGVHPSHPRN